MERLASEATMVNEPVEDLDNLSGVERQQRLLEYIQQVGRVSVQRIADIFSVSLATARRDLNDLADQGKVQRVHGGAIALKLGIPEPPVLLRESQQMDEKRRIARAAAGLVRDGETIFISSGTTALEVARCLTERSNLTVITNSIPVINLLGCLPALNVVVPGGMVRTSEQSLIGHITEQALAELRADKVIFGIRSIHPEHGLTNDYLPEIMTDRMILKIGRQVIVVADFTKLGRESMAQVAPLASVDLLITDANADAEMLEQIRGAGVQVMVV
jgi:DeoR family transcriptional regulator, aga operon transcriptional repressor